MKRAYARSTCYNFPCMAVYKRVVVVGLHWRCLLATASFGPTTICKLWYRTVTSWRSVHSYYIVRGGVIQYIENWQLTPHMRSTTAWHGTKLALHVCLQWFYGIIGHERNCVRFLLCRLVDQLNTHNQHSAARDRFLARFDRQPIRVNASNGELRKLSFSCTKNNLQTPHLARTGIFSQKPVVSTVICIGLLAFLARPSTRKATKNNTNAMG